MHPLVRDLYKRFVTVGHDYPGGWAKLRPRVKAGFEKQAHLEDEVKRAVNRGRWWVREMQAVIHLKKYRTMKKAYG